MLTERAPEPVELSVEPADPAADEDLIVTGRPPSRWASARLRVAVVAVLAVALAALVVVTRAGPLRQTQAHPMALSVASATPVPAAAPAGRSGVGMPVPTSTYIVYPSLGDDYPVWAFVDIICRASGDTCGIQPDTSADLTVAEAKFAGTRFGHGLAIDAGGSPVVRVLHLFLGGDVDAVLVIGRDRDWIPVPDHPTVAQAITRSQVRGDWRLSAYLYGPRGAVLPTASAERWLAAAALP
jgi:hypothetical protein